jgi:hypothetical protein
VSFSQTNLTGSVFDECDLLETVFNRTDLTSVNFTTAYNYILDPELNALKKASFCHDRAGGVVDEIWDKGSVVLYITTPVIARYEAISRLSIAA